MELVIALQSTSLLFLLFLWVAASLGIGEIGKGAFVGGLLVLIFGALLFITTLIRIWY